MPFTFTRMIVLATTSPFALTAVPAFASTEAALVITQSDALFGVGALASLLIFFFAGRATYRFAKKNKERAKRWLQSRKKQKVRPAATAAAQMQPAHQSPGQPTTKYVVGSPTAILHAAAALDPIAATHASVLTVELIRHNKATAVLIKDKALSIIRHADNASKLGLVLNNDLINSTKLALLASRHALDAIAVADEFKHSHPAAALIWYRAQLEQCLSHTALARAKIVPALSAWNAGLQKATAKKVEAEKTYKATEDFVRTAMSAIDTHTV